LRVAPASGWNGLGRLVRRTGSSESSGGPEPDATRSCRSDRSVGPVRLMSVDSLLTPASDVNPSIGDRVTEFSMEVSSAPVGVARLSRGCSLRALPLDSEHVGRLVSTGGDWPPLLVHRRSLVVIDGMHRLAAAVALNLCTTNVVFFDGSSEEALVEAIRRNVAHGLPLTLTERKNAASRLIAVRQEWSDRLIARTCGLSASTVKQLREWGAREGTDVIQPTRRIGSDGKPRPTNPADQRREIATAIKEDPAASLRAIAVRTGASPATVRSVREKLRCDPDSTGLHAHRIAETKARDDADGSIGRIWSADSACASVDGARIFAYWFDRTTVDPSVCLLHAANVPLSRAYDVVDEALRRARVWSDFAATLERRTRASR
jgi:hypothetical protein